LLGRPVRRLVVARIRDWRDRWAAATYPYNDYDYGYGTATATTTAAGHIALCTTGTAATLAGIWSTFAIEHWPSASE
jgi:hypothetical protein